MSFLFHKVETMSVVFYAVWLLLLGIFSAFLKCIPLNQMLMFTAYGKMDPQCNTSLYLMQDFSEPLIHSHAL